MNELERQLLSSDSYAAGIGILRKRLGKSWDAFCYHLRTDRFTSWQVHQQFPMVSVWRVTLLRQWVKIHLPAPIPPDLKRASPLTLVEPEEEQRA